MLHIQLVGLMVSGRLHKFILDQELPTVLNCLLVTRVQYKTQICKLNTTIDFDGHNFQIIVPYLLKCAGT